MDDEDEDDDDDEEEEDDDEDEFEGDGGGGGPWYESGGWGLTKSCGTRLSETSGCGDVGIASDFK